MDEEASSALQRIADRLAAAIGRPVDLDDPHLRLLAHSSHSQQVDPVRLASIMRRSAPAPVMAHLRRIGVHDAAGPLRVAAAPELGMDARLCVPVRAGASLLGFLWLLDDGQIDEAATAAAVTAAAEAAEVLERARLTRIGLLQRAQSLVLDAVEHEGERAAGALRRIVGEGMLSRATGLHVAVVMEPQRAGAAQGAAIAEAIVAVRHATAPGEAVVAVSGEELIVLLAMSGEDALARFCDRLLAERPEIIVGVARAGEPPEASRRSTPGAGPAAEARGPLALAREQARWAAEVLSRTGSGERVARWEELGPYRYLIDLDRRAGALGDLEPRLCALAREASGRELLCTLERFLDLGGQAREAATALSLHRSSLYHRLGRVEELLGLDLHDGMQRLDAHIAVKAARLRGLLDG